MNHAALAVSAMVMTLVAPLAQGSRPAPPATWGRQPLDVRTLQRLDPGHSDIDPLRRSLQLQQVDLRHPLGFDAVYRLPGNGGATDRLVRMSGAVAAVFPRSEYTPSRNGTIVEIPAGTVFYIGSLPATESARVGTIAPGSAAAVAAERQDTASPALAGSAEDTRVGSTSQPVARQIVTTPHLPSGLMNDEAYRGARVRQLLETAALAMPKNR